MKLLPSRTTIDHPKSDQIKPIYPRITTTSITMILIRKHRMQKLEMQVSRWIRHLNASRAWSSKLNRDLLKERDLWASPRIRHKYNSSSRLNSTRIRTTTNKLRCCKEVHSFHRRERELSTNTSRLSIRSSRNKTNSTRHTVYNPSQCQGRP